MSDHDATRKAAEAAAADDLYPELKLAPENEQLAEVFVQGALWHASQPAKRPDREQIARIQFEIDNVHQIHGDTCLCGFKSSRSRSRTEHLTALFAEAVLALEPEAREEPQSRGWSTEDRQSAQAEAKSRFGAWLALASMNRYGKGCVNGFTLGAEWQEARTTPAAREVTDAEVEAAAQAIFAADHGLPTERAEEHPLWESAREGCRSSAAAALEAAREVPRGG